MDFNTCFALPLRAVKATGNIELAAESGYCRMTSPVKHAQAKTTSILVIELLLRTL